MPDDKKEVPQVPQQPPEMLDISDIAQQIGMQTVTILQLRARVRELEAQLKAALDKK